MDAWKLFPKTDTVHPGDGKQVLETSSVRNANIYQASFNFRIL